MIANHECACGRGVLVVGGLVQHASPTCPTYDEATKSSATLGAYAIKLAPMPMTPTARQATKRLCEAAFRRRAGIIGALQNCMCEWPLKRHDTTTEHDELCPAHETILYYRARRELELGAIPEQLKSLSGDHCALNCTCRIVDVALNGGV
jgi:hypothetical protein